MNYYVSKRKPGLIKSEREIMQETTDYFDSCKYEDDEVTEQACREYHTAMLKINWIKCPPALNRLCEIDKDFARQALKKAIAGEISGLKEDIDVVLA